jgi:hypothetical protein
LVCFSDKAGWPNHAAASLALDIRPNLLYLQSLARGVLSMVGAWFHTLMHATKQALESPEPGSNNQTQSSLHPAMQARVDVGYQSRS